MWGISYYKISGFGQNTCNPFSIAVAHQILASVTNIRCHDLCFGRLVSKSWQCPVDLYTTAHTFCFIIGGSTKSLGWSWYCDDHPVISQCKYNVSFQGVYIMVNILLTHFTITVAHQILALVTNIRCHDFSVLADWSVKPAVLCTPLHIHSVCYIKVHLHTQK